MAITPNVDSFRRDQQKGRFNDPGQFEVRRDPILVARPASGRNDGFGVQGFRDQGFCSLLEVLVCC